MFNKKTYVIVFTILLSFFIFPTSTSGLGEKIKAVSYNIQAGCSGPMDEGTYDLAKSIEVLKNAQADVILLQEANNTYVDNGPNCQVKPLAEAHASAIAKALNMNFTKFNTIAILSKYEFISKQKKTFSNKAKGGRSYIRAVLKTPKNIQFIVYNTHLERFNIDVRGKQLKELAEKASSEDDPTIVGGDLNECLESKVKGEFKDFVDGVGSVKTFPTAPPTASGTKTKLIDSSACGLTPGNLSEHLDYLFGSKEHWSVSGGGIISSAGTTSDHYPVYANFIAKDTVKPGSPVSGGGGGSSPKNPNPAAGASIISDLGAAFRGNKLTDDQIKDLLQTPVPRIKIPGLSFSKQTFETDKETGEKYLSIPFLGEYIRALYQYGIIFIGILSLGLLIITGIQWTIAGSGPKKQEILKRIAGGLMGLVVAISSYAILYTINPELVAFRNLRVTLVQGLTEEDLITAAAKDGAAGGRGSGSSIDKYDGPKTTMYGTNCKTEKSKHSGIGTETLLGKIDCHARSKRKGPDSLKYVILHEGGFTAKGTVAYWERLCKNKGKCYGTHYIIDRNGGIHQIADELKRMSHTPGGWNNASIGIDLLIKRSAAKSTKRCLKSRRYGYYYKKDKKVSVKKAPTPADAIRICVQGYTSKQYAATKKLIQNIEGRTGVTIDPEYIRAHCNTAGNHGDPRGFNWKRLGLNITGKSHRACHFDPAYMDKMTKYANKLYKDIPICCIPVPDPTDTFAQPYTGAQPMTAAECNTSNGVQVPKSQCGL